MALDCCVISSKLSRCSVVPLTCTETRAAKATAETKWETRISEQEEALGLPSLEVDTRGLSSSTAPPNVDLGHVLETQSHTGQSVSDLTHLVLKRGFKMVLSRSEHNFPGMS